MFPAETMAEGSSSKTEAIYTTPSCPATPIDCVHRPGSSPSIHTGTGVESGTGISTAGQTVLNLVDRIKNIGLGSVIGAVSPPSGKFPVIGDRGSVPT